MANRWGKFGNSDRFYFPGLQKYTAGGDCSNEIKRNLLLGKKAMTNLDSILKSRYTTFSTEIRIVKAVVFPVVMYKCDLNHKESWAPENWCFQIVLLEKTLESPLDSEKIKTVNPKGNQFLNIHWKDWCWSSSTLATWCEEPIPWKRPWWWERLKAKEGDGRGWDD